MWKVENVLPQLYVQPEPVPSVEEHQVLFDALSEVRENAIVVDGNGDTLAALFSGGCKLPQRKTEKLIKLLRDWNEDEEANVDAPSGKRSQILADGSEVYVSCGLVDGFFEMNVRKG